MAKHDASAASRFDEYVKRIATALNHADRLEPLRAYLTGLLLPGTHQAALAIARDHALAQMERHAPIAVWVIDDTGIPKKGTHSVGVARQYCGALGKTDNCQVVVTVSLANTTMSVPCAYRLYLNEDWSRDQKRRQKAGVPKEIAFTTKWEIALSALDSLLAEDIPHAPVVADAGYGVVTAFREGLTKRRLSYAVGISAETGLWPPGMEPLPPNKWSGRGRPTKRLRRTARHHPLSAIELALSLPKKSFADCSLARGNKGYNAITIRSGYRTPRS